MGTRDGGAEHDRKSGLAADAHSDEPCGGMQPESRPMSEADTRVVLVDLRIPFFRLVLFFVKVALAMIPATIILALLFTAVGAVIAAITGTGLDFFMHRGRTI
jgi:hypothetical protein